MSPREALNLMDQVAARFNGSREDHVKLQSALAVLNGLVIRAETETAPGPEKVTPEEAEVAQPDTESE